MSNVKTIYSEQLRREVKITKRRRSKHIKIRVKNDEVAVSIPMRSTFSIGLKFAEKHKLWIEERIQPSRTVYDYQNAYLFDDTHLIIKPGARSSTRHKQNELSITVVNDSEKAVGYIEKSLKKYLNSQLKRIVEPLIDAMGIEYELYPEHIRYKSTVSRWGSCSSENVLTFSTFLVQLDEKVIEYVVAHELAHLKHMNHSPEFWQLVQQMVPDYKHRRKLLKEQQMRIFLKKT